MTGVDDKALMQINQAWSQFEKVSIADSNLTGDDLTFEQSVSLLCEHGLAELVIGHLQHNLETKFREQHVPAFWRLIDSLNEVEGNELQRRAELDRVLGQALGDLASVKAEHERQLAHLAFLVDKYSPQDGFSGLPVQFEPRAENNNLHQQHQHQQQQDLSGNASLYQQLEGGKYVPFGKNLSSWQSTSGQDQGQGEAQGSRTSGQEGLGFRGQASQQSLHPPKWGGSSLGGSLPAAGAATCGNEPFATPLAGKLQQSGPADMDASGSADRRFWADKSIGVSGEAATHGSGSGRERACVRLYRDQIGAHLLNSSGDHLAGL
eukprot:jgi/Mesen1/6151/ME000314S05153